MQWASSISALLAIIITIFVLGNQNVIWICTCLGLITGIAVAILDYTLTSNPTLNVSFTFCLVIRLIANQTFNILTLFCIIMLQHPFSMVAFAIALAGIGYAAGKTSTLMGSWSAGKSLQPPEDLGSIIFAKKQHVLTEQLDLNFFFCVEVSIAMMHCFRNFYTEEKIQNSMALISCMPTVPLWNDSWISFLKGV